MRDGTITRREFGGFASGAIAAMWGPGSAGDGAIVAPDVIRWRDDFPALREVVNGRPLAYLDNAATTERPVRVIEAISEFYSRHNANPSRTLHTLARRAAEQYEEARRVVADFIHARDPNEIVWTKGTTEGINLVAAAFGVTHLRAGDEVLLTICEHYSNLLPWRLAAERTGATIQTVDVDDEGRLRLDDLDRKLSTRTRLVAVSHVSNVLGSVNPVKDICDRAHHAGARVLIDGAQSVPHFPVDVAALDCDFFAFSSHKVLGPMGVGVLWARRELLEDMPPYQAGSNMAHEVEADSVQYEHAALKFGAGTPNVSGPIGLRAAVEYLNGIGRDAILAHEQDLTSHMLKALRDVRGLQLLGTFDPSDRAPVFTFTLAGWAPPDIVRELDAEGIAIRAGDMAALPLLKRFGVTAAARASCYLYTTREEVDRFISTLHRLSTSSRSP